MLELGGKGQGGTMVMVRSGFLKETVLPFLRLWYTQEAQHWGGALQKCLDVIP